MLLQSPPLPAQNVSPQPATESSTQASPVAPRASQPAPAVETSTESSPISPLAHGESIPGGVALRVEFSSALDSGTARNGADVHGTLKAPVRTSTGRTLPAGTPVLVTVVTAVPAGKLTSAGSLTLQVERVGNVAVLSDFVECHGQMGARDLPDSNPAKGTEAMVAAGAELVFEVPTLPVPH